jgi:uncharacterized membrane protein
MLIPNRPQQLPTLVLRGILLVPEDEVGMSHQTDGKLLLVGLLLMGLGSSVLGQNPPPAKKPLVGPPSPQSRHYPILLLAFGNDPNWSLRIGLKGPERLDRAGYPAIPLEPAEVVHETMVDSWTYHAKDSATGATVAVHLSREACIDALNDTLTGTPPRDGKFAFRASVDHAQIGTLKGCARVATELFPKINNRPDEDDTDKDKPPALTITNFKPPFAVAYLNTSQQLILKRGSLARMVTAQAPVDFSLSHDGKKLLFTRSDSPSSAANAIFLYDFDSGRSSELLHGPVRQAFWSPDDSRVAFLKSVESQWQVWEFPAGTPDDAVAVYAGPVAALHGWIDAHTALAVDQQDAFWISDDHPQQTEPLKEIYGSGFQVSGSDTIRVHPLNPDLLLISASYLAQIPGHNKDSGVLIAGLFLYEVRSKRRVNLTSPDQWAQHGEWSRDGLQIFFTGADSSRRYSTYRIFWDGTGLQKYSPGSHLVIGQ